MGKDIFLKEARKMNRVDSIPQVVHVQEMFEDNDTAYIVMNYIPGETLSLKIKHSGPMTWKTVQELLLPVAAVMQKVHDAGLIHRDLSPDNLMLQPDGSIRILDLGAAKDLNLHGGVSSMQVAKGGFSPMEQYVQRGNSGPWTDVYSLAATLYYALTGVVPPSAVDRMNKDTIRWDLPPLRRIPSGVVRVLQKAMALPTKDRIQSMGDFLDSIQKASGRKDPRKLLIGAAAALVAGIVLFSILGGSHKGTQEDSPALSGETTEVVETTADPLADAPWVSNVLASTIISEPYAHTPIQAPVFNSRIARYQIVSVTVLDSLASAGADSWDVSQARDGSVMAWTKANGTVSEWIDGENVESTGYDLYIAAEDGINGKYCANLFSGFSNATAINLNHCFHTDYAESMENMFYQCDSLESLDAGQLNTGRVRNMAAMFKHCGTLTELDVSGFDTSNVENMHGMFAYCSDLTELDLRNFNTSKVTDMYEMFNYTPSMKQLNISSFDTSQVTTMSFMFSFSALTRLDLSHFDTSSVTSMSYMFSNSKSLEYVDTTGWDTSKVTYIYNAFSGCKNLETVVGITDWDTSSVTNYDNFMDEGIKIDGQPWENLFQ